MRACSPATADSIFANRTSGSLLVPNLVSLPATAAVCSLPATLDTQMKTVRASPISGHLLTVPSTTSRGSFSDWRPRAESWNVSRCAVGLLAAGGAGVGERLGIADIGTTETLSRGEPDSTGLGDCTTGLCNRAATHGYTVDIARKLPVAIKMRAVTETRNKTAAPTTSRACPFPSVRLNVPVLIRLQTKVIKNMTASTT